MPNKKQKRKQFKKGVENNHRKKFEKLKARTKGTEDDRARLEAAASNARKFIRERQATLQTLAGVGASFNEQLMQLQAQSERLTRTAEQAQEEFKGGIPDTDSVDQVIQERDEAEKEAGKLRAKLNDQTVELAELRLAALEEKEPRPPKWLVRVEQEFEKTARIPVREFMREVADKTLAWARDYRRIKNDPKSRTKKTPAE